MVSKIMSISRQYLTIPGKVINLIARVTSDQEQAMRKMLPWKESEWSIEAKSEKNNYSNLSFGNTHQKYESLNEYKPQKQRMFRIIEEIKKEPNQVQAIQQLPPGNFTQINMNISYDAREVEPGKILSNSETFGVLQMPARQSVEETKNQNSSKVANKPSEATVAEENNLFQNPNEQAQSKFLPKDTMHDIESLNQSNVDIPLKQENNSVYMNHPSNPDPSSIPENKNPDTVGTAKIIPPMMVKGKKEKHRNDQTTGEKSVSLSFSSKYPEDDESRAGIHHNNVILDRIGHIKSGLDSLNNNLSRFESRIKEVKDMGIDLQTISESRNIESSEKVHRNTKNLKKQMKESKMKESMPKQTRKESLTGKSVSQTDKGLIHVSDLNDF